MKMRWFDEYQTRQWHNIIWILPGEDNDVERAQCGGDLFRSWGFRQSDSRKVNIWSQPWSFHVSTETLWDPVGPCGTLWDPVGGGFGTAEWNSAVSCRNSLQQNRPINHWRGLGTMQGCPIGFAFGVHFLVSTHVNFKIQILRANEKNWLQNQSRQMPFRDCVSTFMSCNIL